MVGGKWQGGEGKGSDLIWRITGWAALLNQFNLASPTCDRSVLGPGSGSASVVYIYSTQLSPLLFAQLIMRSVRSNQISHADHRWTMWLTVLQSPRGKVWYYAPLATYSALQGIRHSPLKGWRSMSYRWPSLLSELSCIDSAFFLPIYWFKCNKLKIVKEQKTKITKIIRKYLLVNKSIALGA